MRPAPTLTIALLIGPVLAGLAGTIAPALGFFPALGGTSVSPAPFLDLFATPGIWASTRLSLTTGLMATTISLAITALVLAGWAGTRSFGAIQAVLSPLLSVPHAAAAFGLAFLIAPSGWISRLASPWLTGWERPPDLLIVNDPWGLAMIAGLVVKEVPFLLLMSIAALPQTRPGRSHTVTASLGYTRLRGWFLITLPQLYARIRLPVYAVLAYSMSVVDVALILGPTTPPPLAVRVVQWMNDPDLSMRFQAAAAAVWQLALVIGSLFLWRLCEYLLARWSVVLASSGRRGRSNGFGRGIGLTFAILVAGSVLLGLGGLVAWSFAGFWGFPDVLPDTLTSRHWARHGSNMLPVLWQTVLIAVIATALAVVLVLACLQTEVTNNLRRGRTTLWLLYLPLLMPQVAFLPGFQTWALFLGIDLGTGAVTLTHLVFVLPYVMLSLEDTFRAVEPRHMVIAASLGASPTAQFWRIRLPILLAPVLTAAAVGFAVSIGQYLPTLLIGAGRVQTLTTEAVALASGGDRRVIGGYALAQTGLVMLAFASALALPRLVWANRRALREAA